MIGGGKHLAASIWPGRVQSDNAGRGNIGQMFSLERWQADGEVGSSPFGAQGRGSSLTCPPLEPLRLASEHDEFSNIVQAVIGQKKARTMSGPILVCGADQNL
jgi:hypothetical protein